MVENTIRERFAQFQETLRQRDLCSWRGRIALAVARILYQDEQEYLDDPGVPIKKRLHLIKHLGRVDMLAGYHRTLLGELNPLITSVYETQGGRPVRILDLGAGSGGLLKAIHLWARKKKIPVQLNGLDMSLEFITQTQERLNSEGVPVTMIQGDACDLSDFKDRSIDIIVSLQMVHHVRDVGKLARLFSEVDRVTRAHAVIVDFDRLLWAPFFVCFFNFFLFIPLQLNRDGVKSARRAYPLNEIVFILRELQTLKRVHRFECKRLFPYPHWMVKQMKGSSGVSVAK